MVVPPEHVQADGSISTKRFWYAAGIRGTFTLSGRRIDAPSSPLIIHGVNEGAQAGFRGSATWATAITFPTPGCWRLNARVANLLSAVSLSFVMKVVPQ